MSDDSGSPGDKPTGDAGQTSDAVTKADLQAFADGMFANVRRMVESMHSNPSPPAKQEGLRKPNKPDDEIAELRNRLEQSELNRQFSEAVADKGLSKDAREILRDAFMSQRPEDAAAWVEQRAKAFAAPEPQAEQKQESREGPVSDKPVSDAGTPQVHSVGESPRDVSRWTHEDFQQFVSAKAKDRANWRSIKNREMLREIRRRAEAEMARTRIQLGTRKE